LKEINFQVFLTFLFCIGTHGEVRGGGTREWRVLFIVFLLKKLHFFTGIHGEVRGGGTRVGACQLYGAISSPVHVVN
jgi:hypothetical protein